MRGKIFVFPVALAFATILCVAGRREARAAPIVAVYTLLAEPGHCPTQAVTLAVAADLHVSADITPPAAISATVRLMNSFHPDYVVLVGDYLGHSWPNDPAAVKRALAPLAALRPRVGSVAVLGNGDWIDGPEAIAGVLRDEGVNVLRNNVWVGGDAAFLGIEEITSNTANPALAWERYAKAVAHSGGHPPPLTFWIAHNPTLFDRMASTGTVLFAGHTHGGQVLPAITVPFGRALVWLLRSIGIPAYWPAEDYVRGFYRRGQLRMLLTSGIGTSDVPLRLGVPPEIMLVHVPACPGRRPNPSFG